MYLSKFITQESGLLKDSALAFSAPFQKQNVQSVKSASLLALQDLRGRESTLQSYAQYLFADKFLVQCGDVLLPYVDLEQLFSLLARFSALFVPYVWYNSRRATDAFELDGGAQSLPLPIVAGIPLVPQITLSTHASQSNQLVLPTGAQLATPDRLVFSCLFGVVADFTTASPLPFLTVHDSSGTVDDLGLALAGNSALQISYNSTSHTLRIPALAKSRVTVVLDGLHGLMPAIRIFLNGSLCISEMLTDHQFLQGLPGLITMQNNALVTVNIFEVFALADAQDAVTFKALADSLTLTAFFERFAREYSPVPVGNQTTRLQLSPVDYFTSASALNLVNGGVRLPPGASLVSAQVQVENHFGFLLEFALNAVQATSTLLTLYAGQLTIVVQQQAQQVTLSACYNEPNEPVVVPFSLPLVAQSSGVYAFSLEVFRQSRPYYLAPSWIKLTDETSGRGSRAFLPPITSMPQSSMTVGNSQGFQLDIVHFKRTF